MDLASVSCWLRDVITVWFWITFTSRPLPQSFLWTDLSYRGDEYLNVMFFLLAGDNNNHESVHFLLSLSGVAMCLSSKVVQPGDGWISQITLSPTLSPSLELRCWCSRDRIFTLHQRGLRQWLGTGATARFFGSSVTRKVLTLFFFFEFGLRTVYLTYHTSVRLIFWLFKQAATSLNLRKWLMVSKFESSSRSGLSRWS
jgi:hypothetical protein